MAKSKLIPTGYRVLIKPDPLEKTSAGGIVIVHADERLASAATQTGVLIAVGETAWNKHKGDIPWCKVGDKVVYAKYAGKLIKDPETKEELLVVNDEDILAIRNESGEK